MFLRVYSFIILKLVWNKCFWLEITWFLVTFILSTIAVFVAFFIIFWADFLFLMYTRMWELHYLSYLFIFDVGCIYVIFSAFLKTVFEEVG